MKLEACIRSVFSRNTSSTSRPLGSPSCAALVAALLFTLAGCRSNTVVLDERPAWVVDAEQRLKQEPVFDVNESEAHDSRPLWGRQPTDDASKPQESSTVRKRRFPQGAPTTSPTATLQPEKTSRAPIAQPDSVSWSETKVTVEVEN